MGRKGEEEKGRRGEEEKGRRGEDAERSLPTSLNQAKREMRKTRCLKGTHNIRILFNINSRLLKCDKERQ